MRGFVLTGDESFLRPNEMGRAAEREAIQALAELERDPRLAAARLELATVADAAANWRTTTRAGVAPSTRGAPASTRRRRGRPRRVRQRAHGGRAAGDGARRDPARARRALDAGARLVRAMFIVSGVLILLAVVAAALALRRVIIRPLARLAGEAREVARGLRARARPVRPGRDPLARDRRRGDARADRRGDRRPARRRAGADRAGAGAPALQRGARAVRLRRLARPAGAAAQGRELHADARAPLQGAARRARRPVHRVRGRRGEADAGADQRPAGLLARRADDAAARARRRGRRSSRRRGRGSPPRWRSPAARSWPAGCPRSPATPGCSPRCSRT